MASLSSHTLSGSSHNAEHRPAKSSPPYWPGLFPVPTPLPKSCNARAASCQFRKFLVVVPLPPNGQRLGCLVISHFLFGVVRQRPFFELSLMGHICIRSRRFCFSLLSLHQNFTPFICFPERASCQVLQLNLIMIVSISWNDNAFRKCERRIWSVVHLDAGHTTLHFYIQ